MHYNKDLSRTCGNGNFVSYFDFDELPPFSEKTSLLQVISSAQIDEKYIYERKPTDSTRLNRLEDICKELQENHPEMWLCLDMHDQDGEFMNVVYECLERYGLEERTVWRYAGVGGGH